MGTYLVHLRRRKITYAQKEKDEIFLHLGVYHLMLADFTKCEIQRFSNIIRMYYLATTVANTQ